MRAYSRRDRSANGRPTSQRSNAAGWVNLAGWWGSGGFYVGGELLAGDEVDHVRLTTRDQVVLEDDTAHEVVLFLAAQTVELPVTLELCDRRGQTIATQIELDFD